MKFKIREWKAISGMCKEDVIGASVHAEQYVKFKVGETIFEGHAEIKFKTAHGNPPKAFELGDLLAQNNYEIEIIETAP